MLFEKAKRYAENVLSGKEVTTFEVKKQCEWFLIDLQSQKKEEYPYYFDQKKVRKIEKLLNLMNFATGIGVRGKPILSGLVDFQAFFIANVFGWRFKDKPYKFRYNDITLFIPRKNAKTFIVAVIIILLMLTEDEYAEFYSICIDRDLAATTKKMVSQILENSPYLSDYFKVPKSLTGKVECAVTKSYYQPRTAEANRNNSIQPSAFVADEIGAFKDNANITAMKSGQLGVRNPIFFKTTTAYAEDKSIMLEELDYLRRIYQELATNDRVFALVYYAEEKHLWDDIGLAMANPLRIEENYNEIKESREKALEKPSERQEFLTKHMNHFLPSFSGEAYINVQDLRKCKIEKIDWTGREVYLGLDLALTTDNVSVTMLAYDNGKVLGKSWAFIPEGRIEEKSKKERENYLEHINAGNCFKCGDLTVNYLFVEDFILKIEKEYGVTVLRIGYDRYNCESTQQKLANNGMETVEVKQHSSVLHQPTKLLEELILNKDFQYEENKLYEVNFQNAKCSLDTNLNKYMNKKKSTGKVDMVASTLDALYLLRLDHFIGEQEEDWAIQVI